MRVAAEALCKLLIFVYVPNANSLFNNKDKLSHAYFKVWDKSLDDNLKIKEGPLNAAPTYGHKYDSTDLGQLASVLLCKRMRKKMGKIRFTTKLKNAIIISMLL